jgi:hypothetical protein
MTRQILFGKIAGVKESQMLAVRNEILPANFH